MQDSEGKEISTDEVQTEYKRMRKNHSECEIFRTRPLGPWGPIHLV